MDLLLISGFTAFIFAFIKPIINIAFLRAFLCLAFSSLATFFTDISNPQYFILHAVAGAFIASILVLTGERLNAYQPTVVHAVRTEL